MQQMNGCMLYTILKRKEKTKTEQQGSNLKLTIKSVRLLNRNT